MSRPEEHDSGWNDELEAFDHKGRSAHLDIIFPVMRDPLLQLEIWRLPNRAHNKSQGSASKVKLRFEPIFVLSRPFSVSAIHFMSGPLTCL